MDKSRFELLRAMPLFGGVRENALEFLLGLTRVVSAKLGDYFFRENDQASSMFILEIGSVAVVKSWMGAEHVLHELSAGDCFGEMALMDMCARSASVRATSDCIALELPASGLLQLYERDCEQFAIIQMNMGREVSRRLREADRRLFESAVNVAHTLPGYGLRSI